MSKFRERVKDQYVKKKGPLEICFILEKNEKKKKKQKSSFFHLFIHVIIYFIKIMFKEYFFTFNIGHANYSYQNK